MRLPVLEDPRSSGFDRDAIARDLADVVEGEVRFGRHDRLLYATDASIYQVEPLGVVIPASVDDALAVVRFCGERGLPILPRGGGTSLAGQGVNRAIVLDFSPRCRGLLEFDASAGVCRVEPGIAIEELNELVAGEGWFFAPDPATMRHANIGGCVGNNAAGARSIKYGRTSESLLGLDVALASGERARLDKGAAKRDGRVLELTKSVRDVVIRHSELIRERFPRTVRRNAGYNLDLILKQIEAGPEPLEQVNLSHLLAGSEGTLAVTLEAELKLERVPAARGLAVCGFDSLEGAIDAVLPILETGPSAVELLDDTVIDLALKNVEYRRYVELLPARDGPPRAALYVEYSAERDAGELRERFDSLERAIPGAAIARYTERSAMLDAWKLRKAGEPLLHGVASDRKPVSFVEDNAVPVERLAEFVRRFREIVDRHGTRAAYWAHASVGVLHIRPMIDLKDAGDLKVMRRIAVEAADLAREMGGVMSGEHGDGRVRSPLLERFYGPELVGAFREIKAIFDPGDLLNPGNIVAPRPVASITERMRVEPEPGRRARVPDVETYYDYGDQHGFGGAVEMCNGAGVCRKKTGGVMCPSYMALLDERHSTRGRGNALRLAITGQFPRAEGGESAGGASGVSGPAWDDPDTIETLDLCLSCKACKSECPSNVDLARLKAEYTAQRLRERPASLAQLSVAHVHTLNRLGSIAPGLSNWASGLGPVRALLARTIGIDRRRSLPRFARPLHKRWGVGATGVAAEAPRVVVYGDTFTSYNEPEIGLAARRVLEAFGYRVELFRGSDAGRAAISVGMLETAIGRIERELERLAGIIEDDSVEAVLFLEPSVLSAVQDDWLSLRLSSSGGAGWGTSGGRASRPQTGQRPVPLGRGQRRGPLRERLAAKSFLVEDFLERRWEEHPGRPEALGGTGGVDRQTSQRPVPRCLLHGHCHQKALWGADRSAALLRRLFPGRVEVLDTTCCGMAGSFGMTRDRYELSMRIGELGLLPAARAAGPEDVVVAPGTSCRHQIHDGAGRRAMHPMELVAAFLSEPGVGDVREGPD